MQILRTRFGKDKAIVAEFLPPKKISHKIIIIASGMPVIPKKVDLLHRLSNKGYWSILLRYRGSWESDGEFLNQSPHQDILDVINDLDKPIVSLWDNQEFNINPKEIIIIGSSFGGPAALLNSKDNRVTKIVCFSGVVDWQVDSPDEPMNDWLENFIRQAFGQAYRFTKENWQKLARGEFYNPVTELDKIDSSKVLFFHTLDDQIVLYNPVKELADKIGAKFITIRKGGHLGLKILDKYRYRRQFWKFLKK